MEIAKIKQVPIRIHRTFFILVALFSISQYMSLGLLGLANSLLLFFALSVSVLLHELGHVFAAKKFGIDTQSVTLYPFGGIAALKSDPADGDYEAVIALAGPSVNFLLVLIGILMLNLGVYGAVEFTALNLVMGIFNLFPAYPMDGGRILRSILSRWTGTIAATKICMSISCMFSVLFFTLGIYFKSITLPLVAIVLLFMIYSENKRLNKIAKV